MNIFKIIKNWFKKPLKSKKKKQSKKINEDYLNKELYVKNGINPDSAVKDFLFRQRYGKNESISKKADTMVNDIFKGLL